MKTVPRTRNEHLVPAAIRAASFDAAYPQALRSAQVRSAAAVVSGAVLLADRADLEQEALTRVWQALAGYDPAKAGLRTFIEVVVSRHFVSMLRSRPRRPELESLDEQHVAGDGGLRATEFRADIGHVLAGLSLFDRAVALSLAECSASETSRGMAVSRAAVYRAIVRLRAAFSNAGLSPRGRARRIASQQSRAHSGHFRPRPRI